MRIQKKNGCLQPKGGLKMFTSSEKKAEIKEKLENAIDEIIADYRQEYSMGDAYAPMEPKEAGKIAGGINTLTEALADSLQHEYIFERQMSIVDVYASDADRIESICENTDLFQHSLIAILLDAVEAGEIDLNKYI